MMLCPLAIPVVATCAVGPDGSRQAESALLAPIAASIGVICPEENPVVCNPVEVDIASFNRALNPSGLRVDEESMAVSLGYPVRDVRTEDVYVCADGQDLSECECHSAGVHLRVEPIATGGNTLVMDALVSWTRRSGTFPAGFSLVRYRYERRDGRWTFIGEQMRLIT